MILIKISGICAVDEVSDAAYETLVETAQELRVAGVRWSPEAYAALEPVERQALVEVGERDRAERAMEIVDALTSTEGRLTLLDAADEVRAEDEAIDIELEAAIDRAFA